MSATFLVSSAPGTLNALRYQGILVADCYVQLRGTLEKSLSADHALLFAEPVRHPGDGRVDWFSPLPGPALGPDALDDAARAAALARARALASDIEALAARLREQGEQGERGERGAPAAVRGHILSLALSYPGEDHIWIVDGRPVVVGWGHSLSAEAGGASGPEALVRAGMSLPPVAPVQALPEASCAATPVLAATGSGLSLTSRVVPLLLGLGLVVGAFLLAGLFLQPVWLWTGGAGCGARQKPAPPVAVAGKGPSRAEVAALEKSLATEQERTVALGRDLNVLRDRLSARMEQCLPPEPVEEEEPPPITPEPPTEEMPSLADLMPLTPDPEPEPAPPPPKKKKARKPKPKRAPSGCGRPIPV